MILSVLKKEISYVWFGRQIDCYIYLIQQYDNQY